MGEYFLMPKLDMSMSEGTIVSWLKNEGDYIALGISALEVETGKVSIEVDNTIAAGNILAKYFEEGETVAVNTPIMYIGSPSEKAPSKEEALRYGGSLTPEIAMEPPKNEKHAEYDYDLAVIGAGQGGYALVRAASRYGCRIALIEAAEPGGVCLNRGCIPVSFLTKAASRVLYNKEEKNLAAAYREMHAVSASIRSGMQKQLPKICDFFYGEAEIIAQGAIRIGDKHISARRIVIASGSHAEAALPSCDGSVPIYIAEEILASPPSGKNLLVYGDGIISCELAFAYSAFGLSVTLACPSGSLLPGFDSSAAAETERILRNGGVSLLRNAEISHIEKNTAYFGERAVACDALLLEGRRSANLPKTYDELKTENGKIIVDQKLRTNLSEVYAIGDCVGHSRTARRAALEGEALAELLFGGAKTLRTLDKPSAYCVHTNPQVAFIGKSQQELEAQAQPYRVGKKLLRTLPAAIAAKSTDGMVKLMADEKYGEILGAVIVADGAEELIGIISEAIICENTIDDLAHNAFLHPSLSEAIGETAAQMLV